MSGKTVYKIKVDMGRKIGTRYNGNGDLQSLELKINQLGEVMTAYPAKN